MFYPYREVSKNIYNYDQCSEIIEKYNIDLFSMKQGDNGSSRNMYLKSININDHPEIIDILNDSNNNFFHFDLANKIECYFGKYDKNCHYQANHIDCKETESMFDLQRKISFSILLNDNFDGGNFCFNVKEREKKRGEIIIFPSFVPHRVNLVTNGTRYVLFGFWLGPTWK